MTSKINWDRLFTKKKNKRGNNFIIIAVFLIVISGLGFYLAPDTAVSGSVVKNPCIKSGENVCNAYAELIGLTPTSEIVMEKESESQDGAVYSYTEDRGDVKVTFSANVVNDDITSFVTGLTFKRDITVDNEEDAEELIAAYFLTNDLILNCDFSVRKACNNMKLYNNGKLGYGFGDYTALGSNAFINGCFTKNVEVSSCANAITHGE